MIAESNYYKLSHMRPAKAQRSKKLVYLENTLAQLQQYHQVCKPLKRPVIFKLMTKYQTLITRVKEI